MTMVTLTPAEIAAGLVAQQGGFRFGLGPSQFTFSIPTAASTWPGYEAGSEPFSGYSVLNAAQAAIFRETLGLWDALIAPNFVERADDATTRGELRAAFTQTGSGTAAYAYSGTPQNAGGKVGDVWISNTDVGRSFARGTYEYEVLIHEIGHTLGLKHPFEAPALPVAFDNLRFTIMSYEYPRDSDIVTFTQVGNSIRANTSLVTAVTPMVLDIAAVQERYGADTTTRTGDDVYRFDQNERVLQSIYDAGGTDTIDLSNFTRPSTIDLRPGSYSSIGEYSLEAQIADWTARFPNFGSFIRQVLTSADLFTNADNLGIALTTTIENAIGGSAGDRITGNAVANLLDGGGGDDVLTGGAGADVFRFARTAAGADRVTDFNAAEDRFDLSGGSFTAAAAAAGGVTLTHGGGTVLVEGATSLVLADWNARVIGAVAVNAPPTVTSPATATAPENVATTTAIYTAAASDPEGGALRFALGGADAGVFAIDEATGAVTFRASPDFEAVPPRTSFAFTVTATDAAGAASAPRAVTLTLTNVNEAPAFAAATRSVSVAENSPTTTPIVTGGAVDPDAGAVLTYSLIGADAAAFAVNAATGAVTFRSSPDFESKAAYGFTLVATDQAGLSASQAISVTITDVNETPPATTQLPFFLLVPSGAAASVQGTGTVFGTIGGVQQVSVLDVPGRLTFDGSFNVGGDRILVPGAAAGWTARRNGASVELSDGDTVLVVPIGTGGADLVFADGVRSLAFDASAGVLRVGSQALTTTAATITAAAGPALATGAASADVASQLLVGTGATVTAIGKATVFGTIAGRETVTVAPGAVITFDGSFNAGGDTIALPGAAAGYTAVRSGSALVLTGGGASATIPIGLEPLTIAFADGTRAARFDVSGAAPVLRLGDAIVPLAPVAAEPDFATFVI